MATNSSNKTVHGEVYNNDLTPDVISPLERCHLPSKAITALLQQVPNFTGEDAPRSVGFPGDENSNQRLAKQLIEAGLPQNKGAPVTQ